MNKTKKEILFDGDFENFDYPKSNFLLNLPTGSGKTLFFPVALANQNNSKILVVVPQRLIVKSNINYYFNHESETKIGGICRNYERWVLKRKKTTSPTNLNEKSVIYMTAGSVLSRILYNPKFLEQFSYVQLDEVHCTEIPYVILLMVLGNLVENILLKKTPFFFLSTATPNTDLSLRCQKFINIEEAYYICGKNKKTPYEITTVFRPCGNIEEMVYNIEPVLDEMSKLLFEVLLSWKISGFKENFNSFGIKIPMGGLFILPGKFDLDQLSKMVGEEIDHDFGNKVKITLLFSGSDRNIEWNHNVFNLIFATNIAESSLTFPIGFVCDSILTKKSIIEEGNIKCLKVFKISKSASVQRCGRVGRFAKGICFKCCSQEDYDKLKEFEIPDTWDGDISQSVCSLINSNQHIDLSLFGSFKRSIDYLDNLKCFSIPKEELLEEIQNGIGNGKLTTELGSFAAKMPLNPFWSMCIFDAKTKEVGSSCLIIAVFLQLYTNGGFFKGKHSRKGLQNRTLLIKSTPINTIITIWNMFFNTPMKAIGLFAENFALDTGSLNQWWTEIKELSSWYGVINEDLEEEINNYLLSKMITNGKILINFSSDILDNIYTDGTVDIIFGSNHNFLSNSSPDDFAIVTPEIVKFVSTNGHQVCTAFFWIPWCSTRPLLEREIHQNDELIALRENLYLILLRMINTEQLDAMREALKRFEEEMFPSPTESYAIVEGGIQSGISVSQKKKIVKKILQKESPFDGGYCSICLSGCEENSFLSISSCRHVFHSSCLKSYISTLQKKNKLGSCTICRFGSQNEEIFNILASFNWKRKSDISPKEERKIIVENVDTDKLQKIREMQLQEKEKVKKLNEDKRKMELKNLMAKKKLKEKAEKEKALFWKKMTQEKKKRNILAKKGKKSK